MTSGWTINGLALPVVDDATPNYQDREDVFDVSGGQSAVSVLGRQPTSLTVHGVIKVEGQLNSYLNTTYLIPLIAYLGTEVTVVSPDGQYDGVWLLSSFQPQRTMDDVAAYYFSLRLTKGSTHNVL